MKSETSKYGARVYKLPKQFLVKQTLRRGSSPAYVVDGQRERHVSPSDDAAIAQAIRDALSGKLQER